MNARVERRVDEGMVEKTKCKLDAEHRANGAIEIRLRQRAFAHAVDERFLKDIVREVVELHVDAGTNGEA